MDSTRSREVPVTLDEFFGRPWRKLRLLTVCAQRKCRLKGLNPRSSTWGQSKCHIVTEQLQQRRCHLPCFSRQLASPAPPPCRSRPRQSRSPTCHSSS